MDEARSYYIRKHTNSQNVEMVFPSILPDHIEIFSNYVRVFDSLSEIRQLYLMFLCNVHAMSDNYILNYNDSVISKESMKSADFIIVNMLFSNMISASRTLLEAMERFLENDLNLSENKHFDKMNKAYDDFFSYRFFCFLRNYCQHGHLAVSQLEDQRFCFDLLQISKTVHFNVNKNMKEEFDRIIEEIKTDYNDEPHLMFTKNIDEYIKKVIEIYCDCLEFIHKDVTELCNDTKEVLLKYPEYICSNEFFSDGVVYNIDNGNVELFFAHDNNIELYQKMREEAERNVKSYDNTFHSIDYKWHRRFNKA